ncbi:MAG: D-2-hydroxyacid dehydrogenase [Dehalococcoidia bacterium]
MAGFPSKDDLNICFAHVAYNFEPTFENRKSGISHFQVNRKENLVERLGEADVLVVSGFWSNDLLEKTDRLKFIQSIGAGVDQFPRDELKKRGIRLASASGVNKNAVSEHAMAHVLAFSRHIHTGRDNQRRHHWRSMISDLSKRENELAGKTMVIVGVGSIGSRVAKLAKAFDMRVLGTKRNTVQYEGPVDEIHTPDRLSDLLPQADYVVLTCPLTPETEKIIDGKGFAAMKESAYLINVARGGCVDEPALLEAVRSGAIAGAGIDHFWDDPLPEDSPFWDIENVLITPHTGGETRKYEENLIDILLENLERLWRGEDELLNGVV